MLANIYEVIYYLDKMIKQIIIIASIIYISLNVAVYFQGIYLKLEAEKYDLNNDGFITGNENTIEAELAMKAVSNDTSRIFAPITLTPISVFFSLIIFLGLYIYRLIVVNRVKE